MDKNEYEEYEQRYRELNHELVVPEFQRFLDEHDIDLSILDDVAEKGYTRTTIKMQFHSRCLNLFNKVTRRFHFYGGKIVSFSYVTDLDFQFAEWNIVRGWGQTFTIN